MPSSTPTDSAVLSPSPDLGRRPYSPSYQDIFACVRSPADISLPSIQPHSFPDLDELFASTVALPLEDLPDGDASSAALFDFGLKHFDNNSNSSNSKFTNISSRSSSSGLFPGSSAAGATPTPEIPASSSHGSIVARPHIDDTHISMTTKSVQAGQPYPSESSCQCLARALGQLAQLSPGTSGWWNPDSDHDVPTKLPDFQHIIAQNEQTSEVIRTILQCSCSNDSFLLVTVSLVVFKIIAWYTAAACAASGQDPIPGVFSSAEWQGDQNPLERVLHGPLTNRIDYDSEGEDQHRIAVQLILSKLAGVQVSVDQLSQCLRKIMDKTKGKKPKYSPLEGTSTASAFSGADAFTRPFSVELTHTLEADLRKRLYELSQAIVERLRRG